MNNSTVAPSNISPQSRQIKLNSFAGGEKRSE